MTRMVHVRPRLDAFVDQMRAKLAEPENQDKQDWRLLSMVELVNMLDRERGELVRAVISGHRGEVVRESADVANIAMMIADRASEGPREWRQSPAPERSQAATLLALDQAMRRLATLQECDKCETFLGEHGREHATDCLYRKALEAETNPEGT